MNFIPHHNTTGDVDGIDLVNPLPEVQFSHELLEAMTGHNLTDYGVVMGDRVRFNCTNGIWLYRITGRAGENHWNAQLIEGPTQ